MDAMLDFNPSAQDETTDRLVRSSPDVDSPIGFFGRVVVHKVVSCGCDHK